MSEIVMSLLFFQFMANLEQSVCRISDARPVKIIFVLIVTLYLSKAANRMKNYLTQLSHYCFE